MFITVLYGDCESLLCNPSCSVVNLLDNIRDRCGLSESKTELDLTDETGKYNITCMQNDDDKSTLKVHLHWKTTLGRIQKRKPRLKDTIII